MASKADGSEGLKSSTKGSSATEPLAGEEVSRKLPLARRLRQARKLLARFAQKLLKIDGLAFLDSLGYYR
jgi:hypothetical protein